jgi:hypothetical protein
MVPDLRRGAPFGCLLASLLNGSRPEQIGPFAIWFLKGGWKALKKVAEELFRLSVPPPPKDGAAAG